MWKYIRRYLHFAVIAAAFMVGEVLMDLLQPEIMSAIIDDGVLGVSSGGNGDLHLIWTLGIRMIGLVLFGGLCGSLNNVFVHMTGQNIGNEMRKDASRRIMAFSFPQTDQFGTGSLVTRVTNDITQVQNFVSQFVRGMIRTSMLMFGSIFAFMNPVMNALMYVAVLVILMAGSVQVHAGTATPGTIIAAITYTTQLLNGILMLAMLFQNISRGFASWRRVREVLHSRPDLKDGGFDGNTTLHGQIEFRDVSFAYPGSTQVVLKNINLTIHPGETVAIMGTTGCGKSSMVNLIPRFYDVTEGAVLVDGVDVRQYDQKALREKIAVALQKSELFSVSILENIAWGQLGASKETITRAAEAAQADSFIRSAPGGYETMVAERGMSLSGGQKQRISIARAVLKNAEILIFDDSTSALDLKTEADLYAALKGIRPESTKIIIAQRVASVRRADCIVVLENGRIAACGTHEELLATCPVYQDIYDSQMGEEEQDGC